ncbi:MAG: hypothetical protein JRI96_07475 [Deltaproteobacteria bacterium]|nr:hypothetical protein [Deltaproteobacteria bacterium]
MIYAEFEEKEFEGPLNIQLLQGSNLLWTPGQVFEEAIGIDAAMFIRHHFFWRLFHFPHPPGGVLIPYYRWNFIWKHRNNKRRLPNFKLNLFIQTKRPMTSSRASKKYRVQRITGRYWRFDVLKHQQEALEKVAQKLKDRALVVYAAPVFHIVKDLYDHIKNNTMVQNSTFPPVIRLKSHKSWIYQEPGIKGWAYSKPEFVEEAFLLEQITSMYKKEGISEGDELWKSKQNLQKLVNIIYETLTEKANQYNPRVKEYLFWFEEIKMVTPHFREEDFQIHKNFLMILLFCTIFNLNWYIIG